MWFLRGVWSLRRMWRTGVRRPFLRRRVWTLRHWVWPLRHWVRAVRFLWPLRLVWSLRRLWRLRARPVRSLAVRLSAATLGRRTVLL